MVSLQTARKLALVFEGSEELPHFETTSFRVNQKIFLTLDKQKKRACIKLSEIQQDLFSKIDPEMIYPVPNKWGKQGWTFIELKLISKKLFSEALSDSFSHVAPKKG